jgi:hypothetical protein
MKLWVLGISICNMNIWHICIIFTTVSFKPRLLLFMPEFNAANVPSWERVNYLENPCVGVDRIANQFRIQLPFGWGATISYSGWRSGADHVVIFLENVGLVATKREDNSGESVFDNSLSQTPFDYRFFFRHDYHRDGPDLGVVQCPSKCWISIDYNNNTINVRAKRSLNEENNPSFLLRIKFHSVRRDGTRGAEYRIPNGAREILETD